MKSYTISKEKLNFSESINIPEPTDPAHADLINEAPKQLLANDIVLSKSFNAVGTELELETGEGGIRINRIYGKTVKSPNLFKFGVTAKDVTEREGRGVAQSLSVSEKDGVLKLTYPNIERNHYNTCYLELIGIDGTKDYKISYKVIENNTGYNPNIHKNTEKSSSSKIVFNIYGNNDTNHVEGGKFFKIANISVTEEEVKEYQPWGLRSAGDKEHSMKIINGPASSIKKKLNGVTVIAKKKAFNLIKNSTAGPYAPIISAKDNFIVEAGIYYFKMKLRASGYIDVYIDSAVNKVFSHYTFGINKGESELEFYSVVKETKKLEIGKILTRSAAKNGVLVEALEAEVYRVDIANIPNLILRGINKEYHDYIDLKRKKIVRKVKKVVLDGSETYGFWNRQFGVQGIGSDVITEVDKKSKVVGLSDRFETDLGDNTYRGVKNFTFAILENGIGGDFCFRGHISNVTSAEQAKAFFRDNPTTFLLAYKKPIEEDLTAEQIKALTSLKSFQNQTTITTADGLAELDVNYGKTESVALGLLADNARVYAESLEKEIEKKSEVLESKIEQEILSKFGKKYIYSQTAPLDTESIWVKISDRNDVIGAETFAHVGGRWKKLTESKISHIEAVVDDLKICPSTEQQGSGTDYWTNESFRNQYGNNRRRAFDDFCEHIIDGNSMIMRVKKVHSNASYGMQMQMWGKLYFCMTDGRRIPFGKLAKENNVETRITFSVESDGTYQYGFMAGYYSEEDSIFSNGGDVFSKRPKKRVYDFKKYKLELPGFLLRTGRYQGNWGKFTFENAVINSTPYPVVFVNEVN